MTDAAHNGRYALHQTRRVEDRLPPEQRPRYSAADVEQITAAAIRRAIEVTSDEPTGRISVPPREERETRRAVRAIRTTWSKTAAKGAAALVLAGTVVGMVYGGCVGVRSEMERAVTVQAAPIRERLDRIEPDIREILRRLPKEQP